MRKHILILMLVLPLLLMSCVENNKPTEEVTSESEDKATNAPGVNDDIQGIDGYSTLDLIQYSREYTPYEAGSGYYFSGTFLESTVTEKLIEYEYNECTFLIYRDPSGNIMVAGSKENYGTDIILQIADETYAYPADNIKIEGFKNVLGHDGVIISFTEGADSRPIIYLSCDGDGWIYPLAMCNKSNYEVDVNGDGVNDLISWRNSQIHVIYMSDGELYTVEIMEILNAEVLNKELNIDGIGCFYDNDTNTFEAGGYKDEEYIAVTAFIKNNILYYNRLPA